MARNDVYLYTNATDPADAVITAQETTTAATFPTLVLGDTPLFNFYFTNGTASWPSFAGNASYSVTWALSDAIAGDEAPYALQTASTAITGGWSIRLPLNTGRLINELQAKKVSQAWPVVQLWQHIRVTDASGYVVSYAMIRTNVRLRAIGETRVTPNDPLPAGTQYVLADETGALSSPANFFAASNNVTTDGAQTITGAKTFSSALVASSTLAVTGTSTLTGNVGIGASPSSSYRVYVGGTLTGSTGMVSVGTSATVGNDVTGSYSAFYTTPSTAGGGAGMANLNHYNAVQGTFTGAVTTQIGFNAGSTLTGATNNYGFRGAIASGSNRYNLYMDGTAQNYLAGVTGIGVAASSTAALGVAASTTGVASFRIPHGTAPSSPVNGDMWTTTAGLYVRINGVTVGPLS